MGGTDKDSTNALVAGQNFMGANLSLEEQILLNLYFSGVQDVEGMTATVEFENYRGKALSYDAEVTAYGKSNCKVAIDQMVLADARQDVPVRM